MRTARTVGEVMEIVQEARTVWRLPLDRELWFRGEDRKHSASTLLPKLYRDVPRGTEKVSKSLLRVERDLHEEFQRCGVQLYEHDADDWDWYFLMQHHNAPTRLLDWSDGVLMAVHFALKNNLNETKGGFVYVLNPWGLMDDLKSLSSWKKIKRDWKTYRQSMIEKGHDCSEEWDEVYLPGNHSLRKVALERPSTGVHKPELPLEPLVLEFPQITRRVAAQRSRFMVFGSSASWLRKWTTRADATVWRIAIPKSSVATMKIQLRDAGITESVIFPDLDGLGRELDQLWGSLRMQARFSK